MGVFSWEKNAILNMGRTVFLLLFGVFEGLNTPKSYCAVKYHNHNEKNEQIYYLHSSFTEIMILSTEPP